MKPGQFFPFAAGLALFCFICSGSFAAEDREKGTPEAPPNAEAVAGIYYRGRVGCNIWLSLEAGGKYTAEMSGCTGSDGEASGDWILKGKRIFFKPSKEEGTMEGHLKSLDVLKYKGQWIFVPEANRAFYDKHGVSRSSCFQKKRK